MAKANGINMVDVKRKNRSSILSLIYQKEGMSRKEIANRLGLTPAAITLITTDLLEEGLIQEETQGQTTSHKGRKEVLLKMRSKKYAAVGVYISRHSFRVLCSDMDNNMIFQDNIFISDCHHHSEAILDKLCQTLTDYILSYNVNTQYKLLGIGISINGIVDSPGGISINSYNIWENNVHVADYMKSKMNLPILLTNNICALANGESFLSKSKYPSRMLFVKYGPGIGAARNHSQDSDSIFNLVELELGHMIMDVNGEPCICGNQGCLETIAGYSSIIKSLEPVFSEGTTPLLYSLSYGDSKNFTMEMIIKSYLAGERPCVTALNRSIFYLALALQNVIQVLNPEVVILYGQLFDIPKFQDSLMEELNKYVGTDRVRFSHFNLQLETIGPLSTIVNLFFENGGVLPN